MVGASMADMMPMLACGPCSCVGQVTGCARSPGVGAAAAPLRRSACASPARGSSAASSRARFCASRAHASALCQAARAHGYDSNRECQLLCNRQPCLCV